MIRKKKKSSSLNTHRSVADRWNSVRSEVLGRWTDIAKPERPIYLSCFTFAAVRLAGSLSLIKKRGHPRPLIQGEMQSLQSWDCI